MGACSISTPTSGGISIGCVASLEQGREDDRRSVTDSGSKQIELLCQWRLRIAGILRLSFPHHVDQLDATQNYTCTRNRLKAEHGSDPPLVGAVVLLDTIIQVGTSPDVDRLQMVSRPVLQPTCHVAGQNGFPVRLAPADDDPLRPAMPFQRTSQEPLRGCEIAPLAEPELDRVAIAVDGAVEIYPPATDLDLGFVEMPSLGDRPLPPIETSEQFG